MSENSLVYPTPRQIEFQDWEFGIFLHFGIRTFYEGHVDFDGQEMLASAFNPSALDCNQWVKTAKEAGVKYMVLTAKHHDGFANWPSEYTDFSVKNSSWKDGAGDLVREFTNACAKYDMRVGLYYSPVDTACPAYEDEKAYDDYFINQISEILKNYGKIDMLWFDGCGSGEHQYDWQRIVGEIRRMQPEVLLFNMGDPDYRWAGNEAGIAPMPCWNAVSGVDIAIDTETQESLGGGLHWLPAECDCRMRLKNWFYSDHDEDTVKDLEELMGLYYYSIGRGANLLLNIGPDRRGLLPQKDAARLLEFGEEIKRRFSEPLTTLKDFKAEDENTFIYEPENPILMNHLVIQEDISKGERIRRFAIKVQTTGCGNPVTIHEGYNVGHKTICSFPLLKAAKVIFEVLESDAPVQLKEMNVFRA